MKSVPQELLDEIQAQLDYQNANSPRCVGGAMVPHTKEELSTDTTGPERPFDIWIEEWRGMGRSFPVRKLGTENGRNFREACRRFFKKAHREIKEYYDRKQNTYYGARLFPTRDRAMLLWGNNPDNESE